MNSSIDSRSFYQTPQGDRALAVLRAQASKFCPCFPDERILPLGCGDLLLGSLPYVPGRMTSAQGDMFSCLVDSKNKPLPDADIDCVFALHAAKDFSEIEPLLREVWRVLKGEGRLLMIVPRRHSAWAKNPDAPFGQEQAYSASQIKKALKSQGFSVLHIGSALFAPPGKSEDSFSFSYKIEKIAPFLPFCCGGVFLIVAQKRIRGIAGAKKRVRYIEPPLPLPLPI
ncbi:MAG: methyltransferase domain-containing protein [Bdellovibrionales bacterium]